MAEKSLLKGTYASVVVTSAASRSNPRRSTLKSVVAGKHVSLTVVGSAAMATAPPPAVEASPLSPLVSCTAAALDALIPLDAQHHHDSLEEAAVVPRGDTDTSNQFDQQYAVEATPLDLPKDTASLWSVLSELAASADGGRSEPPDANCGCGCVSMLRELLECADRLPPGSITSVVSDPTLLDPDTSPSLPRSARHSGLAAAVQVVGPTTLSTRCPISRAPLIFPAVLCGCRHEQPFDALVALHAAITDHRTRAAEQRLSMLLTPYEQQQQQRHGSGNFGSGPLDGGSPASGGSVIVGGGAADGSTLITSSTLAVACPVCGLVRSAAALRVSPPLTEALRQLGTRYATLRVPSTTGTSDTAAAVGHLLWDSARIDAGVLVAVAATAERRIATGAGELLPPRHSVASVRDSSSEQELPLSGF